jgi:hypothetical protein
VPKNRLNPATYLCHFQVRVWISNVIYRGPFCVQWLNLRKEVVVFILDIGGICDHHCLSLFFIIKI